MEVPYLTGSELGLATSPPPTGFRTYDRVLRCVTRERTGSSSCAPLGSLLIARSPEVPDEEARGPAAVAGRPLVAPSLPRRGGTSAVPPSNCRLQRAHLSPDGRALPDRRRSLPAEATAQEQTRPGSMAAILPKCACGKDTDRGEKRRKESGT